MKIRYQAQKGQRIKKGSTKYKGRKLSNFCGISVEPQSRKDCNLWWDWSASKWIEDVTQAEGAYSCTNHNVRNLKQAIRHIKKHDYVPKGTWFILSSRFVGYDILIRR